MHKSNRKTPRRAGGERAKVRVNIRLYADDVAIAKARAADDDVPWQSWLRRHVSKSLARLDRGRIV